MVAFDPMVKLPSIVLSSLLIVGCGSAPPEPAAVPTSPAPSSTAQPVPTIPVAAAVPVAPAPGGDQQELVRNSSRQSPIALEIVLPADKPASAFPSASAEDSKCWKTVELIGDHDKDYASLTSRCGEPTGMLPYTRDVESRLHDVSGGDKKDPRDFYTVKLRGGMCYRFYAVADGDMVGLDMHIYKDGGSLVATSETKSPALVMQSLKPICVDNDGDWVFELDVDAKGKGRYKFAAWARPNKK